MRVLITGANGFVGRNLIENFKNFNLVCLVRKNLKSKKTTEKIRYIKSDITDISSLTRVFNANKINAVIHLASVINSKEKNFYEKVNVIGTKNLIDLSSKNNVKKFIFISTSLVCSANKLNKSDWYVQSKIKAEEIIRKSNLDYCILRPTLMYGKHDNKNLSYIVSAIKKYPILPIISNGRYKIQPLYVIDIIKILKKLLKSRYKLNRTFYVIGDTIEFKELINLICKKLNLKRIRLYIPIALAMLCFKLFGILKITKLNTRQIKSLLSNKVIGDCYIWNMLKIKKTSIEEGILDIL